MVDIKLYEFIPSLTDLYDYNNMFGDICNNYKHVALLDIIGCLHFVCL